MILSKGTIDQGQEWYINIDPEGVDKIREWEYNQPGFIQVDVIDRTDTTITVVYEFEDKASYELYCLNRLSNLDWQKKKNIL